MKIEMTPNLTGFCIEGDFDELYELYDNINKMIPSEESKHINSNLQIYALLYEIRKTYSACRNITVKDNGMNKDIMKYFGKITPKQNVYYSVEILFPQMIASVAILKKYIQIYNAQNKIKCGMDLNMANVTLFIERVISAIEEVIEGKVKRNRIRTLINEEMEPTIFLIQYVTQIDLEYLKLTKKQRLKEMANIIEKIVNFYMEPTYQKIKEVLLKYAEESNIDSTIIELEGQNYPDDVEW